MENSNLHVLFIKLLQGKPLYLLSLICYLCKCHSFLVGNCKCLYWLRNIVPSALLHVQVSLESHSKFSTYPCLLFNDIAQKSPAFGSSRKTTLIQIIVNQCKSEIPWHCREAKHTSESSLLLIMKTLTQHWEGTAVFDFIVHWSQVYKSWVSLKLELNCWTEQCIPHTYYETINEIKCLSYVRNEQKA